MINKYAEINDRILLYNACKGILRVKTSQYYPTEKRAFGPVGAAVGGTALGIGGYYGGDALAKYLKLKDDDWRANALRYGGAGLGAIGGAVGGWFAGPAIAALGGGGAAAGAGTAAAAGAGTASAGTAAAGTTAGSALLNTVGAVGTVAGTGSAIIDLANNIKGKPKE